MLNNYFTRSIIIGALLSCTAFQSSIATRFDSLGIRPEDVDPSGSPIVFKSNPDIVAGWIYPDGSYVENMAVMDPSGSRRKEQEHKQRVDDFMSKNPDLVCKLFNHFGASDKKFDYIHSAADGRVRDADLMFGLFKLEAVEDTSVLISLFSSIPFSERLAVYHSLSADLVFRPNINYTPRTILESLKDTLLNAPLTESVPLLDIIRQLEEKSISPE